MVLAASACGSPRWSDLGSWCRPLAIVAHRPGHHCPLRVEAIVVCVPLPTVCTFAPVVARGLAARRPSHNSVMITA
jgi:hypothetical protein